MSYFHDILTIYHDVHFRSASCACPSPRRGRGELRGLFAKPLVYKNLLALTALAPDYGRWPWGIFGNDDKSGAGRMDVDSDLIPQGDGLVRRIAALPENAVSKDHNGERVVFAHDELTGCDHYAVVKFKDNVPNFRLHAKEGTPHQYLEALRETRVFHQEDDSVVLAPGIYRCGSVKEIVWRRFLSAIEKIYLRLSEHNFLRENINDLNHFVLKGVLSPEEESILAAFAGEAAEYAYLECVPDRYLPTLLLPECERRGISLEEFVAGYINGRHNRPGAGQSFILECAHLWYFERLKSEMANHICAAAAESALNEPARILLRLLHPDLSRREKRLISFALLISFITEHPQYFGTFNYRDRHVDNNFNRCLLRACGYDLAEGEDNANADIELIKPSPPARPAPKPAPVSPMQFQETLKTLMKETWERKYPKTSDDTVAEVDHPSISGDAAAAQLGVDFVLSSYNEVVGKALRETLIELCAGHQTFARVMAGAVGGEAEKQNGWRAYYFLADQAVGRMRTYYEKFERDDATAARYITKKR